MQMRPPKLNATRRMVPYRERKANAAVMAANIASAEKSKETADYDSEEEPGDVGDYRTNRKVPEKSPKELGVRTDPLKHA